MKNSFSLPIRKFLLFSLGMCGVLAAGFLAARGFPRSILIVAGISCVLIASLLLLLSAQKEVREVLGFGPQTDMASNQWDRAESSKVEEEQPRFDPVEFNLLASQEETLQTMRPQARKKGLEIACEVQSDVPELLVGDGSRLRQVLINMVGHTIKFTERGAVIVRVERQSHGQGDCVLHFTVQEKSVAITEGKQKLMAQDFSHADASATRPFEETGPSMTNVLQLVEKMRGRVWVEVEGERAGSLHFTAPFGISASVAIIQPAQDTVKKSLRARDADEDDRAA
jgi:signal transduction histidine kinase